MVLKLYMEFITLESTNNTMYNTTNNTTNNTTYNTMHNYSNTDSDYEDISIEIFSLAG